MSIPMSEAGALRKMCEQVMTSAPRRAQIRYQVLVHFDPVNETGTYETDRGVFPATPEVVEQALAGQHIILTEKAGPGPGNGSVPGMQCEAEELAEASMTSHCKNSDPGAGEERPEEPPRLHRGSGEKGKEKEQETDGQEKTKQAEAPRKAGKRRRSKSGRKQRSKVPAWVLNALVVRARGRCECCGARGYLHIHHTHRWSRGATHDLDSLRLLCAGCHRRVHQAEFEGIPSWKASRAAAIRRREEKAWGAVRGENGDGAGAADP